MRNLGIICIAILGCCLLASQHVHGVAVMSIDFGSEWMKIAVAAPGVPMEIVLNKESKRKTPVAISFRDDERTFGEDAFSVGVKFPRNMYFYLLDLLGKSVDHPLVQLYQKRFPYYKIVEDPQRKTILFEHDSETRYSPEELVAMILNKAKEYAENFAQQQIRDSVITVPAFFNQAERRAMLKAAELAGLKVLQLINSNTAAALDYGIFRRSDFNETAQNILFYDMGASSTVATIASYQIAKTKERGYTEHHPQVSVAGIGYDRTLGGLEIQIRLRDHLARAFNAMKKTKKDVFDNPRAMAKLFKEAGRVKNILSANIDHYAQVENLIDEQDFRLQVSREELEKFSSDLLERVPLPIEQALAASKMTMDEISHIIIVGAGTRMPKVQEILTKFTQRELGKNLNADEAAALGAIYRAADHSAGFQVKKFLAKDAVVFPIEVDFERELDAGEDGVKPIKIVKRTLFPFMNPYPQKKVLTFNKHSEDFSFYVNYGNMSNLPEREVASIGSANLTQVHLSGIADTLNKHQPNGADFKGIKAHFSIDDSGLLSLSTVETTFEKVHLPEEGESSDSATDKSSDSTSSNSSTGKNDTAAKAEKKPKTEILKEELKKEQVVVDVNDLVGAQFETAVKRIAELNEKDRLRKEKEIAQNNLETFILDTSDKLSQSEFESVTTEAERDKILAKCSQISDWLYDDDEVERTAAVYNAKLKELKSLTDGMYDRHREHRDRPEVVAAFKNALNVSNHFMNKLKDAPADEKYLDDDDIDSLETLLTDNQSWLDKKAAEQDKAPMYEKPVFTIKSVADKMAAMDREVKFLVNKAKLNRTKRLKELADKLKEFDKKAANKTEDDKASDKTKESPVEPEPVVEPGVEPTAEPTQKPRATQEQTTHNPEL